MSTIERYSQWNADEIIVLDIGDPHGHDLRRDDLQQQYAGRSFLDVLTEISKVCFMPLAVGGRIRSLDDIAVRLRAGADKCVVNTQAIVEPNFVTDAARMFGSQCIVVSIDAKRSEEGGYEVYSHDARSPTGMTPAAVSYTHLRAHET